MAIEILRPRWGLRPWQPFSELERLERHFEGIFGRAFLPAVWKRVPTDGRGWVPAIEMFEKEDKYVVKAELPGMKEEGIDVSVAGDTLTIKGETKAENETKKEDYYCCERSYGSFSRSIGLPSTVDVEKIEASYDNGVLELHLPKAIEDKPKKITVSTKKNKKS